MTTEAIDPKAAKYDIAMCPLPRCGKPLYVLWEVAHELYLSFTAADLAEPTGEASWQVKCEDGHLIMIPRSDGDSGHVFGRCDCEPDADEDEREFCQHNDLTRLRELLGISHG